MVARYFPTAFMLLTGKGPGFNPQSGLVPFCLTTQHHPTSPIPSIILFWYSGMLEQVCVVRCVAKDSGRMMCDERWEGVSDM